MGDKRDALGLDLGVGYKLFTESKSETARRARIPYGRATGATGEL